MSDSHKARYGTRCSVWKDTVFRSRSQARARAARKRIRSQRDRARAKAETVASPAHCLCIFWPCACDDEASPAVSTHDGGGEAGAVRRRDVRLLADGKH